MPAMLCRISTFVLTFSGTNFVIIILAITMTKFVFICVKGAIPVMDDHFLSLYICLCINFWTFLGVMAKFMLEENSSIAEVNLKKKYIRNFDINSQLLRFRLFALVLCQKANHWFQLAKLLALSAS